MSLKLKVAIAVVELGMVNQQELSSVANGTDRKHCLNDGQDMCSKHSICFYPPSTHIPTHHPFTHPHIYLYIIHSSFHLLITPHTSSIQLPIHLSTCYPSICPFNYQPITHLFIPPSTYIFIPPSIYLPIHTSIHPPTHHLSSHHLSISLHQPTDQAFIIPPPSIF